MACEAFRKPNQTLNERNQEIDDALERLERSIQSGSVKITIGPTGSVAFTGWTDNDDVSDACAFRVLSARSSAVLRMAVARAEALQGRKVNARAVAAGTHSHDGGRTWHKGH